MEIPVIQGGREMGIPERCLVLIKRMYREKTRENVHSNLIITITLIWFDWGCVF